MVVDILKLIMSRYLLAETSDLGPGGRDSARLARLLLLYFTVVLASMRMIRGVDQYWHCL